MSNLENKIVQFMTALQDMYREEDDRQSHLLSALELPKDDLTEDFTAMFYALYFLYMHNINDSIDAIDFVSICNKLVVQEIISQREGKESDE